jgi:hypothetical protein
MDLLQKEERKLTAPLYPYLKIIFVVSGGCSRHEGFL